MAVADFNGDGNPVLGTGVGYFQWPVSYNCGGFLVSLAAGDFNGDGKPDIIAGGTTQFAILTNTTR